MTLILYHFPTALSMPKSEKIKNFLNNNKHNTNYYALETTKDRPALKTVFCGGGVMISELALKG